MTAFEEQNPLGDSAHTITYSRKHFAKKGEYGLVELFRPLQRRKVTYASQFDKFGIRNAARKILGVRPFYEFIMLALHNRHRYTNLRQISRRIIRLGPLHEADRLGKLIKLVRRGG